MKHDFKVGDSVQCLNDDGWLHFRVGRVYKVTDVWEVNHVFGPHSPGFDLDGHHVAAVFAEDFRRV